MKRNKVIIGLVNLGLVMVLVFLNGCRSKKTVVKTEEVVPVKVMTVKQQDIELRLDFVGDIKARDEAIVYARVNGKIMEKVKKEGDPVSKGEALAYLDRDEAGFKFEKAPIESPLSGIVGRLYVDLGTNITPQTPVAKVIDMDEVKIAVDIPEKFIAKIFTGQEAKITVDAYPDEEFTGKVTKISPILDMETRTAPVEITLANSDHRLKSGMFSRLRLIVETHKNAAVIIKEALLGKEPDYYVYVVENNKAITKKINTGLRQAEYLEVTSGLEEGEVVVIIGQQRLRPGVRVEIEE